MAMGGEQENYECAGGNAAIANTPWPADDHLVNDMDLENKIVIRNQ